MLQTGYCLISYISRLCMIGDMILLTEKEHIKLYKLPSVVWVNVSCHVDL